MDNRKISPWSIWKESAQFYRIHWVDIGPMLPLLFVPIFVDAFVAFLIAQRESHKEINPLEALIKAGRSTPSLFLMKFRFEVSGGLWGFIPLLGWYKAYRHRIAWAMASNVIAFEGLPTHLGLRRCKQLVEIANPGASFRTLITIPSMLQGALFALLGFGLFILQDPVFFWVCTFFFLWTLLPWSAAVNSFFYLSLPQDTVAETLIPYKQNLSYKDFCPRCAFFLDEQGICDRLKFNVIRYPRDFATRCNSISFKPRGAT